MSDPVPLATAAAQLGVSAASLRRWVREEGCPALLGGRGRGKGYRVDPEAVRAWRAERAAAGRETQLREIAVLVLDFWRRGCEPGEGHRLLGVSDARAAALFTLLVEYVAARFQLPAPDTLLAAVALQGRIVHRVHDSVKGSEYLTTESAK